MGAVGDSGTPYGGLSAPHGAHGCR